MLPKQYRLKNRSAFKATYKVKNSSHKGGVTLFAGVQKKEKVVIPRKIIINNKKKDPQKAKKILTNETKWGIIFRQA